MSYVDTTLVECNRKSSPAYLGGNESEPYQWMNKCGDGIKLNIGDKISMHSSYISEIGNESSTIEFQGKLFDYNHSASNVTYTKTEDGTAFGDVLYQFNASDISIPLKDNEMSLTHSYYKTTNGDGYYFSLPRGGTWNNTIQYTEAPNLWIQQNDKTNGSLLQTTTTYHKPDYNTINYYVNSNHERIVTSTNVSTTSKRFEIVNDGSRYTLFVQKNIYNYVDADLGLDERRDPALYDYIWYKKTHTYELPVGFNSPTNIGSILTKGLSEVTEIENQTLSFENSSLTKAPDKQKRISFKAKTKTNETFPCSTGWGTGALVSSNFHSYNNDVVVINSIDGDPPAENGLLIDKASFDKAEVGMRFLGGRTGVADSFTGAIIVAKREFPDIGLGLVEYFIYFDRPIVQTNNGSDLPYNFDRTELYYQYQSSYSTIGVKRPEMFQEGRLINNDPDSIDGSAKMINGSGTTGDGKYFYPISSASNVVPNVLTTSWLWTDENLTLLKNYFKTQKLYPEIFGYADMSTVQQEHISASLTEKQKLDNINVSKTRFLHMNDENLYEVVGLRSSGGSVDTTTMTITGTFTSDNLKVGMFLYTGFGLPKGTIIIKITSQTSSSAVLTLSNSFTSNGSGPYYFTQRKVGDDYYNNASGETIIASTVTLDAPALFFDFNPEREDENTGFGTRYDDLRYGFATQVTKGTSKYIGVRFDTNVGGMSSKWFNASGVLDLETSTRCIGFDSHFSSYGNAFLNLHNGMAGIYGSEYNGSATAVGSLEPTNSYFSTVLPRDEREGYGNASNSKLSIPPLSFRLTKAMNEVYIGANNPIMEFDGQTSRFQFRLLHTEETIQQPTGIAVQSTAVGVPVYKLNKVMNQNNYSPSFLPYSYNFVGNEILLDPNIAPYSIMDAHSGIFIEDFCVNELNWKDSVWELLGFTYEQLHRDGATRLDRITATGLNSDVATTNALLESSQLAEFRKDKNKLTIFDPVGNNYPLFKVTQPKWYAENADKNKYINIDSSAIGGLNIFTEISQNCSSTSIRAVNLPRKMLNPIYTVRSDLLSDGYVGGREGNSTLPIIAVCPKNSGYGDFYTGEGGEEFINTIPRTIQNITTTITNPDGSPARVDDSCCVIYRIQRVRQDNSQLAQQILQQQQQQKK